MLDEDDLHKPSYIAFIVVAILVAIADVVFSALTSGGINDFSIIGNGTFSFFEQHHTSFTPNHWSAVTITLITTLWQVAWLAYSVSTLVRYTSYGYLYIAPGHMHPHIYAAYILGCLAHIAWKLAINTGGLLISNVPIALAVVFMYASYGISCHRLYYRGHILQREGAQREALYVRLCAQNGIGICATWSIYLFFLNLDMTLVYFTGLSCELSGVIVYLLTLFFIIVWFFLDNYVFDKFLSYTFSPYLLFLVYHAGSLVEVDRYGDYMVAIAGFILGIAILGTILKIILLIKNQVTQPLWLGDGFFVHKTSYGSLDIYREPLSTSGGKDSDIYP